MSDDEGQRAPNAVNGAKQGQKTREEIVATMGIAVTKAIECVGSAIELRIYGLTGRARFLWRKFV